MSNKEPSRMICTACGAVMNHHADKVEYSLEADTIDPVFGGTLQEVFACPDCGKSELRNAS